MPSHASIFGSARVRHAEIRKLAESPGTLHHRHRLIRRVGLAHAFADVLNASNPIRFGEQFPQGCAAIVSTTRSSPLASFACSTSRSTNTPQR